jgi:hypothetical protein
VHGDTASLIPVQLLHRYNVDFVVRYKYVSIFPFDSAGVLFVLRPRIHVSIFTVAPRYWLYLMVTVGLFVVEHGARKCHASVPAGGAAVNAR